MQTSQLRLLHDFPHPNLLKWLLGDYHTKPFLEDQIKLQMLVEQAEKLPSLSLDRPDSYPGGVLRPIFGMLSLNLHLQHFVRRQGLPIKKKNDVTRFSYIRFGD